jgi:hypothetical protein
MSLRLLTSCHSNNSRWVVSWWVVGDELSYISLSTSCRRRSVVGWQMSCRRVITALILVFTQLFIFLETVSLEEYLPFPGFDRARFKIQSRRPFCSRSLSSAPRERGGTVCRTGCGRRIITSSPDSSRAASIRPTASRIRRSLATGPNVIKLFPSVIYEFS